MTMCANAKFIVLSSCLFPVIISNLFLYKKTVYRRGLWVCTAAVVAS
jgi:Na+(H+)/acetate symporter ActP